MELRAKVGVRMGMKEQHAPKFYEQDHCQAVHGGVIYLHMDVTEKNYYERIYFVIPEQNTKLAIMWVNHK